MDTTPNPNPNPTTDRPNRVWCAVINPLCACWWQGSPDGVGYELRRREPACEIHHVLDDITDPLWREQTP